MRTSSEWEVGHQEIEEIYQALLMKWLWRFGMRRETLWRRVVEEKYGIVWGEWCTNVVKGPYGVSL
jgi:hypothetical protein